MLFLFLLSNAHFLSAIFIGFTHQYINVSENMALSGEDIFPLSISLSSSAMAERDHLMKIRVQESKSSAIVEPLAAQTDSFDVIFGNKDNANDPITVLLIQEALKDFSPSLTALIRNDKEPEDTECFSLLINPVDIAGRRNLFKCIEEDVGASSFFCEHTICIEDNDGMFSV